MFLRDFVSIFIFNMVKTSLSHTILAGISSEVLTLKWPTGTDMANIPRFETTARRLRYRAIAEKLGFEKRQTLLLGHHQDDNVETAIFRLIRGQGKNALLGMQPFIPHLPECEDLFKIQASASIDMISSTKEVDESRTQDSSSPSQSVGIPISQGGTGLCRPFLRFSKERILATLAHHRIECVTDPTNFDPTLTPRNAIRHLITEKKLPQVFMPTRMQEIIKRANEDHRTARQLTLSSLSNHKILNFATESGRLLVQFPQHDADKDLPQSDSAAQQTSSLSALTSLVAPRLDTPAIEKLISACHRIYNPPGDKASFTLDGVHCSPISSTSTSTLTPAEKEQLSSILETNPTQTNLWLLTREPFRSSSVPKATFEPRRWKKRPKGVKQVSRVLSWDNRFWLRIRALNVKAFSVRAYSADDKGVILNVIQAETERAQAKEEAKPKGEFQMEKIELQEEIKTSTKSAASDPNPSTNTTTKAEAETELDFEYREPQILDTAEKLEQLLSSVPGKSRYTIPVIVDSQDRVRCFPTLNARVVGLKTETKKGTKMGIENEIDLEWEAQYKNVDLEVLKAGGWLDGEGRVRVD